MSSGLFSRDGRTLTALACPSSRSIQQIHLMVIRLAGQLLPDATEEVVPSWGVLRGHADGNRESMRDGGNPCFPLGS